MLEDTIKKMIHHSYWDLDTNCAGSMLQCLSALYDVKIEEQTMHSTIGLHGAGGFRAQCGLVEGSLLFIGIFFSTLGRNETEISALCYQFAEQFTDQFSSLLCFDLRPNGFTKEDPPHACEELTTQAVLFTYSFIQRQLKQAKEPTL